MEKKGMINQSITNGKTWQDLKPFVNGFITGQLMILPPYAIYKSSKVYYDVAERIHGPELYSASKRELYRLGKSVSRGFIVHATCTTAQLGIFDTLKRNIADANGGTTKLYQDAYCGLIAGGVSSSIYYPILNHTEILQKVTLRHIYDSLHSSIRKDGFLALWKGGSPLIVRSIAYDVGMFASFDRSLNYLEKSLGVDQSKSLIGAGIVSAFFGVTCWTSCDLPAMIKLGLRENCRKYPFSRLASSFFLNFVNLAPLSTFRWLLWKSIEDVENVFGY